MNIETQINNFLITGNFINNIDEFGNVNLFISASEANQEYISFELANFNYKNNEIENLYNVEIEEIKTSIDIEKQKFDQSFLNEYNKVLSENQDLKDQLNDLVSKMESDPSESQLSATKDIIIDLRIKLKEGNKPEDFSDEFPFNLKTQ
jgi:hypothetical protein